MRTVLIIVVACLAILPACQRRDGVASLNLRDNSAAVALLQKVNTAARDCWIKSKDKDFRKFALIPELDTRAGRPRILVVEKKTAQGLPQFVIEADGNPAKILAYGPLGQSPLAGRINSDIAHWASGGAGCNANA